MREVLVAKFKYCGGFRKTLINTGDKSLKEDTHHPVWGVKDNCQNKLGKIFQSIRANPPSLNHLQSNPCTGSNILAQVQKGHNDIQFTKVEDTKCVSNSIGENQLLSNQSPKYQYSDSHLNRETSDRANHSTPGSKNMRLLDSTKQQTVFMVTDSLGKRINLKKMYNGGVTAGVKTPNQGKNFENASRHIERTHISSKVIGYIIGPNDLSTKSEESTADECKNLHKKTKLLFPHAHIILYEIPKRKNPESQ